MKRLFILFTVLVFSGCSSRAAPPSVQQRKAPCDQLAAQAIQTDSLELAKNLAAQASECYSGAQSGVAGRN